MLFEKFWLQGGKYFLGWLLTVIDIFNGKQYIETAFKLGCDELLVS